MFLQTSITHLLIFLFFLPQSSRAYYSDNTIIDCGSDIYTKKSQYHDNLKILLSSLNSSTPATGYFQDSQASFNGSNEVFGVAMCRGDLKLPEDCVPCLKYAVSEIGKLCLNKENAAVLYDYCFLRYSNQNFFGNPTGTEQFLNYSAKISKNREEFVKVREKLFEKLLVEATDGTKSPPFFAADTEAVSSDLSIFGLLQCTRDLLKEDCHDCLQTEIDKISTYGGYSIGLILFGRSCFLRYKKKEIKDGRNPLSPKKKTIGDIMGKMIGIIAGVLLFAAAMVFLLWFRKKKKNRRTIKKVNIMNDVVNSDESENDAIKIAGIEHLSMKFMDLSRATNHFSKENMIGRGGFGYVYKGILNEQEIAVKRMNDKDSLQAAEQLDKEVTLLAGLQHVNLVRLIGYCIQENEMLLVYEYMANGSLETHLFDADSSRKVLNWTSRLNIIDGIIKGIQYLHEDSRLKIFHRDLKPENILLDRDLTPKITDFGISKSSDVNQTRGNITTNIIGTGGYMAPEYRFYGQFTSKSDIYSLGVMLLEILTCIRWSRCNNTPQNSNLRSYMSSGWKDATLSDKLAKIECKPYTSAQEKILTNILHIAMLCIENDPDLRPKISDVRDFIKFSNSSGFKISHMSPTQDLQPISESSSLPMGKIDDDNPLFSLTMEMTTNSMPSKEIAREMKNDNLR